MAGIRKLTTLTLLPCFCLLGCMQRAVDESNNLYQSKQFDTNSPVNMYDGFVAAAGADWLELRAGYMMGAIDGQPKPDTSKPLRLSAAGTMSGGVSDGPGTQTTNLVSDLNAGDRVRIQTARWLDNTEFVLELIIRRRPGGRIPPMFGDPFAGTEHARHLQWQAYQDWEEHRIPLPAKYCDKNGQCEYTSPPYPVPVAPPPRPVKP